MENDFKIILEKYNYHDCLANWDGSARAMEGEGGRLLIIEIADSGKCFVRLLVKDDDGTITAASSPRELTKEEKESDLFSPLLDCLDVTGIRKIPDGVLPFIASKEFNGERSGYVLKTSAENGCGYHFDSHPEEPRYLPGIARPKCLDLQNERGKFAPDYEFIEIGALADPQHRCRNFGKDITALAKAPLHESYITDEQAARIIRLFKYCYRQSTRKSFKEIND